MPQIVYIKKENSKLKMLQIKKNSSRDAARTIAADVMRHMKWNIRSFCNEIFAGAGHLTGNLLVANFRSSPKKGGRMRSPLLVWSFTMKVVGRQVVVNYLFFCRPTLHKPTLRRQIFLVNFMGLVFNGMQTVKVQKFCRGSIGAGPEETGMIWTCLVKGKQVFIWNSEIKRRITMAHTQ